MPAFLLNRSHNDHPMHLHGHHVLVLSRNGTPVSGSPGGPWADTVEVLPGEAVEVAFRADNPGIWGIWMDHCHNQRPAAHRSRDAAGRTTSQAKSA